MSAFDDLSMEGIMAIGRTVSLETGDELTKASKTLAANLIVTFGDQCFTARGFVASIVNTFESSLVWLIAEGHVVLTEKGTASAEVQAERLEKSRAVDATPSKHVPDLPTEGGAYL